MDNNLYNHYFKALDLDKLKKLVSNYASFEMSKNNLLNESIILNPLLIKKQNLLVEEALSAIAVHGRIQFDGLKNIDKHINKLKRHQVLNINEVFDILEHLITVRRIKKTLIKQPELKELKDYIDGLYFNDQIIERINRSIDNNLKIKKDASKTYAAIIDEIDRNDASITILANELLNKYQDSLQDKLIYTRDNRLCLLMKNRDKYKFGGYIHGQSASGISTYVEPKELVNANNDRIELDIKKNEEEENILRKLSLLISEHALYLEYNLESLVKLDTIFAKADYGFVNKGICATFNDDKELLLEDVAHPLIAADKVVTNTYQMPSHRRKIIISGSNTGGKTVALKTIALSTLMAYLAIPIIATKAVIPFYDAILYAVDDNQSITKSLSSFSASLVKIDEIITYATNNSLVLIDELGSGTDPKEGEAFAIAVVEYLRKIDAAMVVTTHFNGLKDYAKLNDDMLLAGVGFDLDKLSPTYHYLENDYGTSNSFKIAGRYLNNQDIIKNAISFYHSQQNDYELLRQQLEKDRAELELRLKETAINEERINNLKEEYSKKIADLKNDKENILADYKLKYDLMLEEAKTIIKQLRQNTNHKESLDELAKLDLDDDFNAEVEDFSIGDLVKLKLTNQSGRIINIKGLNITIDIDGRRLKTSASKLTKVLNHQIPTKKIIKQERSYDIHRPKPVNVIGMNSSDALSEVSKYIDKLLQARLKNGHIIHGFGKGILRKCIRKYLSNNQFIKEYHDADINNGGSGATDIILK